MSLLDYDYEDLARQVQTGLERVAINFLKRRGARVRKDVLDFHGFEQVDLEVRHGGHTLRVRQVGRPRGPGYEPAEAPPPGLEEIFESTFDGRPASAVPVQELARWLRSLPVGEAEPEPLREAPPIDNPFASPDLQRRQKATEPAVNPFLAERAKSSDPNPFAPPRRNGEREELLRRLRGED